MNAESKRPALPDVTLVAVTSVALGPTIDALRASMDQADFGKVLLLSDRAPEGLPPSIEWRQIAALKSRPDYSRFMLSELAGHIETSHALCIQWDGFVINGGAWDEQFLEFDYIGSVWPQFRDGFNVGNGGFSLRSRRLFEACRELPLEGSAEDIQICRTFRPRLEDLGMRFAPEGVARQFSFERTPPTGREFGFHGVFNLVPTLAPAVASSLFRRLELNVLSPGEHRELLRWALRRGRWGLAATLVRRLMKSGIVHA